MNKRKLSGLLLVVTLAAGFVAGCKRDPVARKHAYFESGTRYFDQGKYREAAIELQNAIKVDPRYADAHYELSGCYEKLKICNGA